VTKVYIVEEISQYWWRLILCAAIFVFTRKWKVNMNGGDEKYIIAVNKEMGEYA
jgi:hypothetical protein